MKEQIKEYHKFLEDHLKMTAEHMSIASEYVQTCLEVFDELFPITDCPNCGETTCTEQCEFELERQRTTLKADTTPVTGETVEEAALIAYPVPSDGNTKHTILQINYRGAFINGAHWQKQQLNTPVTTTLKVDTVSDEQTYLYTVGFNAGYNQCFEEINGKQ